MKRSEFDIIFQRHRPRLIAAIRRLGTGLYGMDTGDVEQEVAIRLWKALASDRKIDHLPSYLVTIVRSVVADHLRRPVSKAEHIGLENVFDLAGEEDVVSTELVETVERKLAAFPDNRRVAVRHRLRGLTAGEIATLEGWTSSKAENLVKRGMRDLRNALAPHQVED